MERLLFIYSLKGRNVSGPTRYELVWNMKYFFFAFTFSLTFSFHSPRKGDVIMWDVNVTLSLHRTLFDS